MTAAIVDACPMPVERRPDNPDPVSSTFWMEGPSLGAVAFFQLFGSRIGVFRTTPL
jgi:hypothetical protein